MIRYPWLLSHDPSNQAGRASSLVPIHRHQDFRQLPYLALDECASVSLCGT